VQYDLSTATYSPDGRVFQIEYALKAVDKSGLALGVRCLDGVVLGVEKLVEHKMLVPSSGKRIGAIDKHAGMALAGLAADAQKLLNVGKDEAYKYRDFYGTQAPGHVLASRIAYALLCLNSSGRSEVHTYTLYVNLRPFGASVLLATYDDAHGPQLYTIDPVGTAYRYFGAAIAKQKAAAKTELEKIDFKKITCREAVYIISNMWVFVWICI
jgi:20S proteasome subunit alpha 7